MIQLGESHLRASLAETDSFRSDCSYDLCTILSNGRPSLWVPGEVLAQMTTLFLVIKRCHMYSWVMILQPCDKFRKGWLSDNWAQFAGLATVVHFQGNLHARVQAWLVKVSHETWFTFLELAVLEGTIALLLQHPQRSQDIHCYSNILSIIPWPVKSLVKIPAGFLAWMQRALSPYIAERDLVGFNP